MYIDRAGVGCALFRGCPFPFAKRLRPATLEFGTPKERTSQQKRKPGKGSVRHSKSGPLDPIRSSHGRELFEGRARSDWIPGTGAGPAECDFLVALRPSDALQNRGSQRT